MPLCPPIYRRSLHDALPISPRAQKALSAAYGQVRVRMGALLGAISESVVGAATIRAYGAGARTGQRIERAISDHRKDRKSTRLNSSHVAISYAVFCLNKKKT